MEHGRKRGRKPKHFTTSDGAPIPGLSRRPDGRWRVIATGEEYRCADEALAIHLYYTEYTPQHTAGVELPVPMPAPGTPPEACPVLTRYGCDGKAAQIANEGAIWAWVRQQILKRPEYAAKATGIEQIAYLGSLQKPEDSPTLKEVFQLYLDKGKVTHHWRTKSTLFWSEFADAVEVKTLREVTQELMISYRDGVLAKADSPTYAKHRFGCIKTALRFPRKHGKWALDCDRALAFSAVLVPPESAAMNPHPISREAFRQLLEAAKDDPTMTAVLLVGLNCCMYPKEVSDVRWHDVDLDAGTLVMRRSKTKVPRVACLWGRTVEALRQMPRATECPFVTAATRQPHNANTINKAFRGFKKAYGLDVEFNHIRDGSFTAAIGGEGVQWQHAQILAGHRTGMADAYVLRNPKLVADACKAVERAYFHDTPAAQA